MYYVAIVLSVGWLTRDSYLLIWLSYLISAVFLRRDVFGNQNGKRILVKGIYPVIVIPLLVKVGHEIFRYTYYGNLLPNTFYLKALNWDRVDQLRQGMIYSANFFVMLFPLLLLLVSNLQLWLRFIKNLSAITKFTLGFSLCAILLQIVYVTWIGGDKFINFRFYIMLLPFLVAILVTGLEVHKKNNENNSVQFSFIMSFLLTVLFIVNFTGGWGIVTLQRSGRPEAEVFWNDNETVAQVRGLFAAKNSRPIVAAVATPEGNIRTAIEILSNSALSSMRSVAVFQAGTLPYLLGPQYYCVDLLGKMDPYIARLKALDGFPPGHNKWDISYSITTYQPDIIVSLLVVDREKPVEPQIKHFQKKKDFLGALFRDDVFLQNYELFSYISNGYDIYIRK